MKTFAKGMSLLAVIAFVFGAAGSVSAKEINIKDNMFKYAKVKYWRGKAENIQLGSYGQKKGHAGGYVAVQNNVGRKHLKGIVKSVGPYNIKWENFKSASVNASATLYIKNAGGAGAFDHSKAKKAKLKLMKFFINEGPLQKMLNKKAKGARNYMKKEGGDARIVSEIWVVMEAQIAEDIANGGNISVSGTAKGVKFNVGASGSSKTSTSFTLPAGSTFAYLTHKVSRWNKKRLKKTTIRNMEDDQVGIK